MFGFEGKKEGRGMINSPTVGATRLGGGGVSRDKGRTRSNVLNRKYPEWHGKTRIHGRVPVAP